MKPYPSDWTPIFLENESSSDKVEAVAYNQKKYLYGLSKEEFLGLSEQQGHRCAVCQDDASEHPYTLNVDHDHATNEIRGLLCTSCNTALGWLNDDPDIALRAAGYLRTKGTGVFIPVTGSTDTL